MFDEQIREYGVGQYCADWEKIQAEWYMQIDAPVLKKIELREADRHIGFAISQESGTHTVRYPHIYGMRDDMHITLCICGEAGSLVKVLVDGHEAGRLALAQSHRGFVELTAPLQNEAGEHCITLELTGRLTLDWFRLL
jgi:hypothetical protein